MFCTVSVQESTFEPMKYVWFSLCFLGVITSAAPGTGGGKAHACASERSWCLTTVLHHLGFQSAEVQLNILWWSRCSIAGIAALIHLEAIPRRVEPNTSDTSSAVALATARATIAAPVTIEHACFGRKLSYLLQQPGRPAAATGRGLEGVGVTRSVWLS